MKQLEWFVSGIVILALAIMGLLYAFSGPGPEVRQAAEEKNRIAEGIRLAVEQRGNMVLTNFVPGAQFKSKQWDFRAEAAGDGRIEPVYGVARLVCERVQPLARCWQIIELERDGRKLISAPREDAVSTTGSASAPDIRTTPAPVAEPEARPEPAPTPPPAQAAPAAATPVFEWQVTGAAVNGRAGPGTTFPVVARLTPEHRLRLIEVDNRWGQYEIVSPAADAGQRMWIWSDLVTEIK